MCLKRYIALDNIFFKHPHPLERTSMLYGNSSTLSLVKYSLYKGPPAILTGHLSENKSRYKPASGRYYEYEQYLIPY